MKLPDHQAHLELAASAVPVFRAAQRTYVNVRNLFGASKKVSEAAARFAAAASSLRCALDAEYHVVTSDEQFKRSRNPYYPGDLVTDHADADMAALEVQQLSGALACLIGFVESASDEEKLAFREKHAGVLCSLMLFGNTADGILAGVGYVHPSAAYIDEVLEKFHKENDNAVE